MSSQSWFSSSFISCLIMQIWCKEITKWKITRCIHLSLIIYQLLYVLSIHLLLENISWGWVRLHFDSMHAIVNEGCSSLSNAFPPASITLSLFCILLTHTHYEYNTFSMFHGSQWLNSFSAVWWGHISRIFQPINHRI